MKNDHHILTLSPKDKNLNDVRFKSVRKIKIGLLEKRLKPDWHRLENKFDKTFTLALREVRPLIA